MKNTQRNILITGSSSGIGLETANFLKTKGFRVFQTGRKKCPKYKINEYLNIDLDSFDSAKSLHEFVCENFGCVDILINNAGEYLYAPIDKTKSSDIRRIVNINYEIPYYLTSLVTSGMKERKFGRIINVSSISAVVGEANASLYASSKAALIGLTKSLALELAQDNITVNSISPGWVDTPLAADALDEDEKKETLDVIPQKRFIEPVEIANLILYLISDEAKGLTGQNINLCAGLSVGC